MDQYTYLMKRFENDVRLALLALLDTTMAEAERIETAVAILSSIIVPRMPDDELPVRKESQKWTYIFESDAFGRPTNILVRTDNYRPATMDEVIAYVRGGEE